MAVIVIYLNKKQFSPKIRRFTMLPKSRFRVSRQTADDVNDHFRRRMKADLEFYIKAGPGAIDERLKELDEEWDIERSLETNAAFVGLLGLFLGKAVNRRFYLLSAAASGFLLQHALQGWCPPLPIFRRRGVRTVEEIEAERMALKMIRGDFRGVAEAAAAGQIDSEKLMNAVEVDRYFKARSDGKRGTGRMPKRDITGECEEVCRDRVLEGEKERQAAISKEDIETGESPPAPGAEKRTEQPGVYGGHV